jgi:transposase
MDHRTVINVFFRGRAGLPWRDLPPIYGNWNTIYNRHRRWSLDGTWENCPRFIPLMETIRIKRRGLDRPGRQPGRAMGDKAYSPAANRAYLRRRGIKAVIPVKDDQAANRKRKGRGRPPAGLRQ